MVFKQAQQQAAPCRTLALAVKFDLKDSQLQDYDGPTHVGHSKLCDPSNFAQAGRPCLFRTRLVQMLGSGVWGL